MTEIGVADDRKANPRAQVGSQPSLRLLEEGCYIERSLSYDLFWSVVEECITTSARNRVTVVVLVGHPGSGKSVFLVQLQAHLQQLSVNSCYDPKWDWFQERVIRMHTPPLPEVLVVDDLFRMAVSEDLPLCLERVKDSTVVTSCLPAQYERVLEHYSPYADLIRVDMLDPTPDEITALSALFGIDQSASLSVGQTLLSICMEYAEANLAGIRMRLEREIPRKALESVLAMAALDLDCPLALFNPEDELRAITSEFFERIGKRPNGRVSLKRFRQKASELLSLTHTLEQREALVRGLLRRLCLGDSPHPMARRLVERMFEQHGELGYPDALAALAAIRSDPILARLDLTREYALELAVARQGSSDMVAGLVSDPSAGIGWRSTIAARWLIDHAEDLQVWKSLRQLLDSDVASEASSAVFKLLANRASKTERHALELARSWLKVSRGESGTKAWIISNVLASQRLRAEDFAVGGDVFAYLSSYLNGQKWTMLPGTLLVQILHRTRPANAAALALEWLDANPNSDARSSIFVQTAKQIDAIADGETDRFVTAAMSELDRLHENPFDHEWQDLAAAILRLASNDATRMQVLSKLEPLVGQPRMSTIFEAVINYALNWEGGEDTCIRHILLLSENETMGAARLLARLWPKLENPELCLPLLERLAMIAERDHQRHCEAQASLAEICKCHQHHKLTWSLALRLLEYHELECVSHGALLRALLSQGAFCDLSEHNHESELVQLLRVADRLITDLNGGSVEAIIGKTICAERDRGVSWNSVEADMAKLFAGDRIPRSGRALAAWLSRSRSDKAVDELVRLSCDQRHRKEARYAAVRAMDALFDAIERRPQDESTLAHLLARSVGLGHPDAPRGREALVNRRARWPIRFSNIFQAATMTKVSALATGTPLYLRVLSERFNRDIDRFVFSASANKNVEPLRQRLGDLRGGMKPTSIVIRDPYALKATTGSGGYDSRRLPNLRAFMGVMEIALEEGLEIRLQYCHLGDNAKHASSLCSAIRSSLAPSDVSFEFEQEEFHERMATLSFPDQSWIMIDMNHGVDAFLRCDAKSQITVHVLSGVTPLAA